jgi:tetrahydromethanopterin S-methyltransferase subunit B
MSHVLKSLFFSLVLIISPKSIITKAAASVLTLEDLDYLGSGTPRGYKLAAQEIKQFGNYDAWVESKNGEIYKGKIDPAAPDTGQAITNVKNILSGIIGAPLIQDAQAVNDKIAGLEEIIDNGIDDIDSSLGPLQRTLPNAIASVKTELGGTPDHTLLEDAQAKNVQVNQLIQEKAGLKEIIDNGIDDIDSTLNPLQRTLPNAIQSVKTELGGRPEDTLLEDAQAVNGKIANLQAIIDNGINDINSSLNPPYRTLPNAIESVKTELGGADETTLLEDAQAAMRLPNSAKKSIDPNPNITTLSAAIESVLDRPDNYAEMRRRASPYLNGSDADNPSIRSELIILYNIVTQNYKNPILHIDGARASGENVTLADIIVALTPP